MRDEIQLAKTFAERRGQARDYLLREMLARGMREEDGWRIVERIRGTGKRTELFMRPMHLHLPTPEGIECVVEIDDHEVIDSHCEP